MVNTMADPTNIEITVDYDISYEQMDVEVISHGFNKDSTTTFCSTFGWIAHTPLNEFDFKTIGAAKRSARKMWTEDGNRYFIIYNTFGGVVTVDIAQIYPI